MKQDNRATITVDKELRDKIKEVAAKERISIYELIEALFHKYTLEGRLLR